MRATGAWFQALKQRPPTALRRLPGEEVPERREVQAGKLNVELPEPRAVRKTTSGHPRFHRLGHLLIQQIEPFQAVAIHQKSLHGLHRAQHAGNVCGDDSAAARSAVS